jgi:hypothetical protein
LQNDTAAHGDPQDFIKMDTKTIATADGPSTQWMAVIGNPCAQPGVLDDPFVSPFDGGSYTLAQRAPSLACTVDGGLVGATLSDHGEVIIGMFQDTFETKEESAAHAAGQGLAFQDGASADFTSTCADRAVTTAACTLPYPAPRGSVALWLSRSPSVCRGVRSRHV